jgi:hypothetical protein
MVEELITVCRHLHQRHNRWVPYLTRLLYLSRQLLLQQPQRSTTKLLNSTVIDMLDSPSERLLPFYVIAI